MSHKSAKFQRKLSIPREVADINKEASNVLHDAGQVQYSIKVYETRLRQLNARLAELDREMQARNTLNAQKPAETPEVKNEQS